MKNLIIVIVVIILIAAAIFWLSLPLLRVAGGGGIFDVKRGALNNFKLGMKDSHILVWFPHFEYKGGYRPPTFQEYPSFPGAPYVKPWPGGYGPRDGGFNNTLEIKSWQKGIELKWSYNCLYQIEVQGKWHGQTECGLRLGDSIERLKQLYPTACQIGGEYYEEGDKGHPERYFTIWKVAFAPPKHIIRDFLRMNDEVAFDRLTEFCFNAEKKLSTIMLYEAPCKNKP